jgi:hypothetical protein
MSLFGCRWKFQAPLPLVLSGVVLIAAACALNTTYRYADWLVLWKINQYFDLNREQKNALAGQLKMHLAHHRKEALPVYVSFLSELRDRVRERVTRRDLEWMFATYDRLRADLFEGFVTDGTAFLVSVDEEQIRNLEQRFKKDNDKAEKLLQESVKERLAERADSTLELLHDWLGPLSKEQERRITELSLALPDTQPLRLKFHRERQQILMQLLRPPRDRDAIAQALRDWVVFPERRESPAFRQALQQMRLAIIDMALAIDPMLTRKQREHALRKLQELIDDIKGLSAA